MNKKSGVTASVVTLAVVIMFIILTSATIIGSRNIDTVNYEEYMSQLNRVSDGVNQYISSLTEDLANELSKNGDTNNNLYIVDMNKVTVNNVSRGNGTAQDRDVFLVAENTNNVYYYKGYKYRWTMYYGV